MTSSEYHARLQQMDELGNSFIVAFQDHDFDAIAFSHQRRPVIKIRKRVQSGRNGLLASMTGVSSYGIPGETP
jgi:hypothetical protein